MWRSFAHPATVVGLISCVWLGALLFQAGGDALVFARLGAQYSPERAVDPQGYDGQFVYYIARDWHPQTVEPFLDVPAYRYQRILLPLAARLLSLGIEAAIPWALLALGLASHTAGTWLVAQLLEGWGITKWFALVYGLWVGLLLAVRLDLPEPLAYALIAGALLAGERNRTRLGWGLYALALFAKEVTLLFVAAQWLADVWRRRWSEAAGLAAFALLPFALFQGWLWEVFGEPGVGSGGAMATPFEGVPFMGLLRVGVFSLGLLGALAAVYLPFVYLPALWGVWASARAWLAGRVDVITGSLFLHGLVVPFLPFSTVREPGGLLRLISGLVLAAALFAARGKHRRAMKYAWLWLVLNIFLVKS